MSRLAARFAGLRAAKEGALVCFLTAGDPSAEKTVELVAALARAGADAVEIGLPFSDPLADGPSIQAASQRALAAGMNTITALEVTRRCREGAPDLPLVLMTYFNPVYQYGLSRFAAGAAAAGADGVIVTDLTPEEAGPWKEAAGGAGLDTIFLLAPTSTPSRIEIVSRMSTGFVYCVSRTGVTGARRDVPEELTSVVARIRSHTAQPVCVGFGISEPAHVRSICAFADGVVVGSALVDMAHSLADDPGLLNSVETFIRSLKAATLPAK